MKRRLVLPMLATFLLIASLHAADASAALSWRWRPVRVSTQQSAPLAPCTPASQERGNSRVQVQNWRGPLDQAPSSSRSTFPWGAGIHYGH